MGLHPMLVHYAMLWLKAGNVSLRSTRQPKSKEWAEDVQPLHSILKTTARKAEQELRHRLFMIACQVFKERVFANIRRRKAHSIKTL
jgi:hypothetical protein